MKTQMILKQHTSIELYYTITSKIHFFSHRENNKPSYIHWDGYRTWHRNGLLWRENGFALIYPDGRSSHFFKDGIRQ